MALVEAFQATDFESQLQESQAEDAIIAPEEGSKEATVASSQDAPKELVDKGFDVHLEDNFDGIDWACLPKYIKPVAEPRQRKSWIQCLVKSLFCAKNAGFFTQTRLHF
jgi:hypothetical protein